MIYSQGEVRLRLKPAGETRNERSRPTTPPPNRQYNASPGEERELLRILRRIAEISDLNFSAEIRLVHDKRVKKRQMEEILDAGLGEPWMIRKYCGDEEWAHKLDEERKETRVERETQISHSGMELLGEYDVSESKIFIFDTVCEMVSCGMRLKPKDLVSVVLAHEASHAVTHLGRDVHGRMWDNFEQAEVNDQELFAQIYDFLYLRDTNASSLENVFRQLSARQSSVYNLWKNLEGEPVGKINGALLETRLKSRPHPMKSYIEGKRTLLPLSRKTKDILKHLELLESSIGDPDSAWERGYRVTNAIMGDPDRLGRCVISGVDVNVISSGKKGCGGCAPVLLVIIGYGRDGFESRIAEAARHVAAECRAETESVVFWTARWYSLVWMEYASSFKGVSVVLKLVGADPMQLS